MRNLSNLGLVEMTEQEMREVNGGWSRSDFLDLVRGYINNVLGYNVPDWRKCTCDDDWFGCDYCPCCSMY